VRPVLVHAGGNAVLLGLGYYWLGLGESRASALLWSALVALLWVALAAWLYGSAFAHFRGERMALRHIPYFVVAMAAALAIYWLLGRWAEYSAKPAFQIASFLTMTLHWPVRPATVQRLFNAVLWLVRWMIVPSVLLPMFSAGAFASVRSRTYFAMTALLMVCAVWLPMQLLQWVPRVGGFGMQMASFIARALVAYLLFVLGGLLLAFVVARR
jgi:hypothetical protein